MTVATPPVEYAIPYERQSDADSNRTCGAACLSMVYRSLGIDVPQDEIWKAIAKPNRFGNVASTTHLMVRDALNRGLDAVAVQARHPFFVLRLCRLTGIRVVLNHWLSPDTGAGHYTVLADVSANDVVLHDPYYGPSRHFLQAQLRELWQPVPNSEIAGNTLIAVARPQPEDASCEICRAPIPARVACPQCHGGVTLRPAAGLGCISEDCIVRLWNYVCCPSCDYMWNFSAAPPEAAESELEAPKPDESDEPQKLQAMFAELDKFCAAILATPALAANQDILNQIDFIKSSKEKLMPARAEQAELFKKHELKLEAYVRQAEEKKAAHLRKMDELTTPSPPLDGNALGEALLKSLGLIG